MPALVLKKITDIIPQQPVNMSNLNIPSDLSLADEEFYKPAPIEIQIGAGLFFEIISLNQIKLGKNKPVLQETKYGWMVSGPVSFLTRINPKSLYSFTCTNNLQNLLPIIRALKLWEYPGTLNLIHLYITLL